MVFQSTRYASLTVRRFPSLLKCLANLSRGSQVVKRELHTTGCSGMRFVQFRSTDDAPTTIRVGLQKEAGGLVDLTGSLTGCHNLVEALGAYGHDGLKDIAKSNLGSKEVEHYHLLAPVTSPDKVICIGLNYRDHCLEVGLPIPPEPVCFSKFPSTIIGPYDGIPYPDITQELDWEVELAAVIGKPGKNIDVATAKEHVFGYTVAHDVTARDWQMRRNGGQWLLGKSMDGFCPLGPCVVSADEIKDPHDLAISLRVNGEIKQNSNTNQLVHNVYDCISWLSKFCKLLPGDVILTGTPAGVGFTAKPRQLLKRGDVVECTIDRIGVIRNTVV